MVYGEAQWHIFTYETPLHASSHMKSEPQTTHYEYCDIIFWQTRIMLDFKNAIILVWIRNQLDATNSSMDTLPANRFWQPSCNHGTIPTRGDNTTQSSAPEDGYMVARNMLSNL